ncbi:MAG TPA: chemotaxis protein CheA [Rhodanobacteraceae bacterium]|nr:chemotaxis protein CheA [Rhodanobacteraceae bacterium]
MDVSEFYESFFEEAGELLDGMEAQLLALDLAHPDPEQLNAIFRAAHSIKGGAGTFGFEALQRTTHLLENLLDAARRGELTLRRDLVDIFLETKDMLDDQLNAYRQGQTPDPEALERICAVLQRLANEEIGGAAGAAKAGAKPAKPAASKAIAKKSAVAKPPKKSARKKTAQSPASGMPAYRVMLLGVNDKDRDLLIEELGRLGQIENRHSEGDRHEVVLVSSESAADIEAVMCFIVEPEQLKIEALAAESATETEVPAPKSVAEPEPVAKAQAPIEVETVVAATPAVDAKSAARPASTHTESSLRVPVNKVDHIINLVGELIITQSMLNQAVGKLNASVHANLVAGINLLERNARDLQEAVMSVRMVPMDNVFSRFPRLVRDLAAKLDKDVELVTEGRSTELDKSLTEQIVDPLTHLVRNSLDHGIEHPDEREAAGKPRTGTLTLSAEHQGGNIVIEVSDDGAGLSRAKILAKARERGMNVSDAMSDEDVWQLIFAPGFSTAAQVSNVSGRGVGMDVVKRNIEGMGGHVEVVSRAGRGTTTRVVLPLTLAILDGMSVRVGRETFILPVTAVIESLQPRDRDLHGTAGGDLLLKVREDYLPIVAVHEAMGVSEACVDATRAIAVVVQGRGRRYALLVDELVGQQQVVVKNLETNYRKVPGVSAATIMGDGSVALILDVNDLCQITASQKENGVFADNVFIDDRVAHASQRSSSHHESRSIH